VSTREQLAYWYSVDPSDEFAEHLKYAVVHDLSPLVDRLETSGLTEVIDFVDEYMTQRQLSASMKNELVEYFSPKIQQTLSADYFQSETHRLADHSRIIGQFDLSGFVNPRVLTAKIGKVNNESKDLFKVWVCLIRCFVQ